MSGAVDFSQMPWWVGILAMLISGLGSYLATRKTSEDKAQANLVTQTVARQKQLDERYEKMVDNLQEDMRGLREEILMVRKELNQEKNRNEELSKAMDILKEENRKLREENSELKAQVEGLKSALQKIH